MSDIVKPHLTYKAQIDQLKSRGMEISDEGLAIEVLREYGYYKFSGYFYPLRKHAPPPATGEIKRLSEFVEGVRFEHVYQLIIFDRKLISILSQGLAEFEVGLRAQVAYILGSKSKFFHLDETLLHPRISHSDFLNWLGWYAKNISFAKDQDFVKHHANAYKGKLPIWVAVEVMQFGTLQGLLNNLNDIDQQTIADEFGFYSKHLFLLLVDNFRRLRNDCAHNNRLWNSSLNKHLSLKPKHLIEQELFHLSVSPREKIYSRLTLLSYALDNATYSSTFKADLLSLLDEFPSMPLLTPEKDMGFPEDLMSLDFWARKGITEL